MPLVGFTRFADVTVDTVKLKFKLLTLREARALEEAAKLNADDIEGLFLYLAGSFIWDETGAPLVSTKDEASDLPIVFMQQVIETFMATTSGQDTKKK